MSSYPSIASTDAIPEIQREDGHTTGDVKVLQTALQSTVANNIGIGNGRKRKQHRPRLSIISAILKVARQGARKTHIMYKANLSYGQLEDYLAFLTDIGLIKRINDGEEMTTLYSTSLSGLAFLEKFEALKNTVDLDKILSLPHRDQ